MSEEERQSAEKQDAFRAQTQPKPLAATTPGGIYELCDAKRLLAALNLVVQQLFEGFCVGRIVGPTLESLDAITDKLDAAVKAIEASK